MRLLIPLLVLALFVSACAPRQANPIRSQGDTTNTEVLSARADSLLALPPDSLSAAEWEWLRVYEQRAEREETRSDPAIEGATIALLGVVIVAGVVAFWVFIQGEEDDQ